MTTMETQFTTMRIGPYEGAIDPAFDRPEVRDRLGELADLLSRAEVLSEGRNRIALLRIDVDGEGVDVAVKTFAEPGPLKRLSDRRSGSKARRSWRASRVLHEHGGRSPRPVAYLERWDGCRLMEAHYLSVFEPDAADLRRELIRIYREEPVCSKLMQLLQVTADAIRDMHDAGVLHRDLGNQNIRMRRTGATGWSDVQFIDLNRARVRTAMSLREKARDISRLHLPSDLLRIFKEMYFGARPPAVFDRWERFYRKRYAWHSRSRKWRHPFRDRKRARIVDPALVYPDPRDIWIWDDRSAQAINVLSRKDRNKRYPRRNTARMVASTLGAALPVSRRYRKLMKNCYRRPVEMKGRIGVAVDPAPGREDETVALVDELGPVAVLVRYYHHEETAERKRRTALVERLKGKGHRVAVALVQDRRAVTRPASWDDFVADVLDRVHEYIDEVEVGHAVNRVKWGVWSVDEHRRLLESIPFLQEKHPELCFMGPAGIDFEYPHILPLLRDLPTGVRLGALSHHLYVDRRGAPENRQGPFGTLEKLALARAIAGWTDACDDRLVVSEVNWPLRGTGVYSPIGSPYLFPGQEVGDASVSEDDYANYMLRYLLIALCSGFVERVYWWRLVAHGFGLVDDRNPGGWRRRPAFLMLKQLMQRVGQSTFTARLPAPAGAELLQFVSREGERLVVAYAPGGAVVDPCPSCTGIEDAFGRAIPHGGGGLRLTGRPVYLREACKTNPKERPV